MRSSPEQQRPTKAARHLKQRVTHSELSRRSGKIASSAAATRHESSYPGDHSPRGIFCTVCLKTPLAELLHESRRIPGARHKAHAFLFVNEARTHHSWHGNCWDRFESGRRCALVSGPGVQMRPSQSINRGHADAPIRQMRSRPWSRGAELSKAAEFVPTACCCIKVLKTRQRRFAGVFPQTAFSIDAFPHQAIPAH